MYKKKLEDARAFILVGFDLQKWYIPLLIHRLNRIGEDGGSRFQERPGIGLDITNSTEERIKSFPIRISTIGSEVVAALERLHEVATKSKVLKSSKVDVAAMKMRLVKLIAKDDLQLVVKEMMKHSKDLGIKKIAIRGTRRQLDDIKKKEANGRLTYDGRVKNRAEIRQALLRHLEIRL